MVSAPFTRVPAGLTQTAVEMVSVVSQVIVSLAVVVPPLSVTSIYASTVPDGRVFAAIWIVPVSPLAPVTAID